MEASITDIPAIRESWIAARASKRRAHCQIERAKSLLERGRTGNEAHLLEDSRCDEMICRGVMQLLATLRLRLRRR